MELSGSKDNKIAEIEMISMLSTNDVVAKISNSVRFMVCRWVTWFCFKLVVEINKIACSTELRAFQIILLPNYCIENGLNTVVLSQVRWNMVAGESVVLNRTVVNTAYVSRGIVRGTGKVVQRAAKPWWKWGGDASNFWRFRRQKCALTRAKKPASNAGYCYNCNSDWCKATAVDVLIADVSCYSF